MICDECRDRLLGMESRSISLALEPPSATESSGAAERSEGGPRATATHLRSCPECRQVAERILAAEDGLRRELAALGPAGSSGHAARMARNESMRRRRRVRRRIGWVAAAAVLVGAVGVRLETTIGGPKAPPIDAAPGWTVAWADPRIWLPEVEVREDENVVVFETADRDVVVFWFYEGREQ